MRVLGLIGGMSWESTALYYRLLNERVRDRLGGLHSIHCLMESIDFAPMAALQHDGRWDEAGVMLAESARRLEQAGAGAVMICTNTMHKVANTVEEAISVPLLHIADATGEAIRATSVQAVGLLGTQFTMEQPFYRQRLEEGYGLDVVVPDDAERLEVSRIIYDELCQGILSDASRLFLRNMVDALVAKGAGGVILGCTELPLLLSQDEVEVPLFDTTHIHAEAAVSWALR